MQEQIHIAIVRLSSLGDVIVSAAILPYIKQQLESSYKSVSITWIIDSTLASILHNSPCLDNIVAINLRSGGLKAIRGIIKQLKALPPFDVVIDMQGLLKSALCGKCLKTKVFCGFGFGSCRENVASIFYNKRANIPYQNHILERHFVVVAKALNLDSSIAYESAYASRALAFGIDSKDKAKLKALLNHSHTCKILCVLESTAPAKCYPLPLFARVIERLLDFPKVEIVLIQHSTTNAESLKVHFATDSRVSVIKGLNLAELKALMQELSIVIGGDTGLTHLAWAMKRASLTLYATTSPARFALRDTHNIFLHADSTLANISPESILEALTPLIAHFTKDTKGTA